MNKAKLKSYAPQARKDFIAAVEARAHSLGLSEMGGALDIAPSEKRGDVTLIAGQAWPAKVHDQRQRLIKRMKKDGFAQTVEAVAYTWFNRFAALRYMEIHDYLDHGYRVLSSREGGLPEIIAHATDVAGDLPGLNASQIADMKLAGNQDGELYRLLLVAQCNALSKAMPFLFEHIDDESELLLPGNLERTDSVVAKLVESIAEEDWNEVEVIGWLYQFYISEKKDAVIGKVVKSEDIPAATQLFTPNWIVQYLVQNSVGRLWLMANPSSTLKSDWKYYIEPAEQAQEVQAQLDALIQTRMAEDGGSLNPETITVLDPACGSGHILVEAYEVLKAIYLERGYQARAIPRLILEKNLFGLDIDDRAAQMAGFALMMKARADDRRLLDSPIKLNVLSLQESKGLELGEFDSHLKPFGISRALLASLIDTFAHAKTFGSLIQIPEALDGGLQALTDGLGKAIQSGDVFAQVAAQDLLPLVRQATVLAMKFDAVVANPPYMGANGMNANLKAFAKSFFEDGKSDLFSMFMLRGFKFVKSTSILAMITMPSWLFLSTFENLRLKLLSSHQLESLLHMGRGIFGIDFGSAAFVFFALKRPGAKGCYFKLYEKVFQHFYYEDIAKLFRNSLRDYSYKYDFSKYRDSDGVLEIPSESDNAGKLIKHVVDPDGFKNIPGCPIAHWVSEDFLSLFSRGAAIGSVASVGKGLDTGDNSRFLRLWFEVDHEDGKWVNCLKGGPYRKWYGNFDYVINWADGGAELRSFEKSNLRNESSYFKPGVTWSRISSGQPSFRIYGEGFIPESTGPTVNSVNVDSRIVAGFLNSVMAASILQFIAPTLDFQSGHISKLPLLLDEIPKDRVISLVDGCLQISKDDWEFQETSRGFKSLPFLDGLNRKSSLLSSWNWHRDRVIGQVAELKIREEECNRIFIKAYGLQDELSPDVIDDQITLVRADREKDCQRLISYAIGCMMGRYSLDNPGVVYAHTGNTGFDNSGYKTFLADADGIVPVTDELWFEDDAANRIREFLRAVWGAETLDENMDWLAESLGRKENEATDEAIRRYISASFYKDHLQTYKKRPIYWHFSSGKQGAFQALVYLHRYHEGTLARMRAEYVVPLTGKMQSRIEMLEKDRDAASATAARTKIAKLIESLKKKHVELLAYDEKLRHYADMRIQLDLDDGVKVNYGKFGDLLAEVKAVTGGAGDD